MFGYTIVGQVSANFGLTGEYFNIFIVHAVAGLLSDFFKNEYFF
jgi:hypothetical protein